MALGGKYTLLPSSARQSALHSARAFLVPRSCLTLLDWRFCDSHVTRHHLQACPSARPFFISNCSTRFEQRADRRKGLLDGLICGQALAFAGINNRAHSRKQVASPVGPKAIGDLPKDCTHANGLLAGVVGGWDRSVFQEQEEIVLDCGVAFLQALALRGV